MKTMTFRLASIVIACSAALSIAHAAPVTFAGTFVNDNDRFQYDFTLAQASTINAFTTSWAAVGGFSANLTLFGAPGGVQVNLGASNVCGSGNSGAPDPTFGFCWDAVFKTTLGIGSYSLVLTQNGNEANFLTIADGFSKDDVYDSSNTLVFDNADYTAPSTGNRFFDAAVGRRNGNWELVFDATPLALIDVPEPGALPLTALALLGLSIASGRRRRPLPIATRATRATG